METAFEKYKGIHPGLILERELKKRNLKKGPFALSLNEYPQTLNGITKGQRGLTPALSLKIDKALGLGEGTMLLLQAYYEIKKEQQKNNSKDRPDLSIIRKTLFWDTDITKIDWEKQSKAVIQRVFERGNDDEKKEILGFYGEDKIKEVTGSTPITNVKLPVMGHLKVK
ncbi:plasmid maintenance system antidote protein VapI [Mucilaginibacter frigoritolerans]|uniref:Plasmid maintenance system antidote protein VapI n=1 Tax=Mucilaginibacter frigoritolerans TaxID=652788 RepID=A0A562TKZ7_9SPHI|nr:plasmid maintenance system antidote protein [Mucilaginibacter frigoritolerans]TWI94207.1 plasmid maintenance system antidote protein VapI [Mucilaginibacter frigoritolerans]